MARQSWTNPFSAAALAVLYAEAAQDVQFRSDNAAIQQDFASLDREVDGPRRARGSQEVHRRRPR